MKNYRLKSFSKINLSLRVIKRLKNKYHKIQSYMAFVDLHDLIYVSKSKNLKDKVIFSGKFKNSININDNTITKVINLLRKKNKLKNIRFNIKIIKKIPTGSGLGGGSSNAATLINFFNSKMNLKLKKREIIQLAYRVGSDVPACMAQKSLFLLGKKIKILKANRFKLIFLIVFPNIPCSTKKIYSKNNIFSPAKFISYNSTNNKKKYLNFLKREKNDLEETVVKIYPMIENLIKEISIQKGCFFSRLTGSGSACFGLFSSVKYATMAKNLIRRKFPGYWCKISKTI